MRAAAQISVIRDASTWQDIERGTVHSQYFKYIKDRVARRICSAGGFRLLEVWCVCVMCGIIASCVCLDLIYML